MCSIKPGGAVVPLAASTRLDSAPLMVLVWFGACSLVVGSARTRAFPHLQACTFWGSAYVAFGYQSLPQTIFSYLWRDASPQSCSSFRNLFAPSPPTHVYWQAADESLSSDAIEKPQIMLHLFLLPYLHYAIKKIPGAVSSDAEWRCYLGWS